MGCGSGRPYTQKDVDKYIEENQHRVPSPELVDGSIKLKSTDGFYNANSLLNSTWLKGKLNNEEYRRAIEHINQRVAQTIIGTPKSVPINLVIKTQTTMLAVEELNAKYKGRARFSYQQDDPADPIKSSILITLE